MEKEIIEKLGYEPVETRWFEAFSVNLGSVGLTEKDMRKVQEMIEAQKKILKEQRRGK